VFVPIKQKCPRPNDRGLSQYAAGAQTPPGLYEMAYGRNEKRRSLFQVLNKKVLAFRPGLEGLCKNCFVIDPPQGASAAIVSATCGLGKGMASTCNP
jgi:hypothetical protein